MAYTHPQLTRYKATQKRSETSTLVILCSLSLVALSTLVAFKMAPDNSFSFINFFSMQSSPEKDSVQLGGIELGSSMASAVKLHPQATKSLTSSGAITLAFSNTQTAYMVWYGERNAQRIAYKARQTRTLIGITEDSFVGKLTQNYGAPSLSSCSRQVTDGIRNCYFSWWIPGSIRLDLTSRQLTKGAIPKLKITLQTTDTRMAMRLQRAAQYNRAIKASSVKVF